ncbi:hypothetical protein OHS33_11305 [Streptomyces sp. NBC_00536]|uniref:hypothetical protein n=1 Tax=Streptomyces sp. NBC_00536 TaxID=2975769 RepID=UPI002E80E078|nr:hypothetical protein [Streptomyces sp. NBC_00536]WUC78874.1 hypothetical protein OHS33_11305 [Streptomyces sp. NBC_00536]
MSTTDVIASLALAVSVVAAVGTIGAWRAAHHAHQAAVILSRIEEERLHSDLTPVFRYQVVATKAARTECSASTSTGLRAWNREDPSR